MDALLQDIRYGIRQLLRQGGSSLVAVLTLALGIGATTAMFSVIDATMLRPLPYPDPEQLVTIYSEVIRPTGEIDRLGPSMEDMRLWQGAGDVLSSVAGAGSAFHGRIADGTEAARIQVDHFTADYLSMHGVTPILGHGFSPLDMEPGAPLVALLGYGYWHSRFGGRADVIGEAVQLDDDMATIVGVLPAWFNSAMPLATPLQVPVDMLSLRGTGQFAVYARMRPGLTIEQASQRLSARMPAVAGVRAAVESRLDAALASNRTTVTVLVGAVGLILAIAAVNVGGLLLARGAARQTEIAVRASLGAMRRRLVRQLLTETVVLALPAAFLGVLLAWLTLDLIVANLPLALPSNSPVTLNTTVLALTVAVLIPTVVLCGLAPAVQLSRVRIAPLLARGGQHLASSLSRRGSQALIAAEVALAVVLVAGAGLMIQSFIRVSSVDLGFKPDGLLTMQVLPLQRDPAAHESYYWSLLQRLRTTPGVASAGIVDHLPLQGSSRFSRVLVAGTRTSASVVTSTPGYIETVGATLRAGQLLTDAQYLAGFRGVVINESAARAWFPNGSAVGSEIMRAGDPAPWTVLGVIADLRHDGPLGRRKGEPQAFFPLEVSEFSLQTGMTVVIRSHGNIPGPADRLREAAHALGPRVLVEQIRSADELFGEAVITPRRRMVLLGLLGGLGLTLTLVGVFGMTAYIVTRRTAEIGVRMAFGARPDQVVGTMLRDSAMPVVVGVVLGVAGASMATRTIESFLFQTSPTDPLTLAVVAASLAATGCLAALPPALRAAKVDPAVTLRAE
jgi:putative ABC transport system permease protein